VGTTSTTANSRKNHGGALLALAIHHTLVSSSAWSKGQRFHGRFRLCTHVQLHPVRVRSATHPNLVKSGTCAHCLLVFSFSSQCTATVPLTSRERPVSRVQTQQIASTSDDHRERAINCARALPAKCLCCKPCVKCKISCGREHTIRAPVALMQDQARFAQLL
jgi:hypothetical protein